MSEIISDNGQFMRSIAAAIFSLLLGAILIKAYAQAPAQRSPGENSSALTSRLERVEEQLVDLQGVVAAVETLAKNSANGAPSGYSAASGGASSEQIRQLSEQIAELTQRLERLEARLGANTAPMAGQPRQQASSGVALPGGFEDKEQLPPLAAPQPPAERKPLSGQQTASAGQPSAVIGAPTASRPASQASSSPARTLFDQAYGALNRREYSAAETYFQQFLEQYPNDPLAGSAQYWLGETAFVSGEYRSAADRFLKTFTNFPNSEKAPEALLKLAISLRRLGESSAACESFAELERRFPQAPKAVMQRAETEKKRANCT
ncbi:MAG TPA: tol-pal system protein YbgF [Hyphomicrobiales bacterium]|nr:tol-pal system protein YbgF [Hyphomicrobiales bacterium]